MLSLLLGSFLRVWMWLARCLSVDLLVYSVRMGLHSNGRCYCLKGMHLHMELFGIWFIISIYLFFLKIPPRSFLTFVDGSKRRIFYWCLFFFFVLLT